MGLKEDLEYCLNDGKCTECKYGNAQSMLICRCLVENVIKEQKTINAMSIKYDKIIKAIKRCTDVLSINSNWCDDGCPYIIEGTGDIETCRQNVMKDTLTLLEEQNKTIIELQCALDKANEKLAYTMENPPYYDCEAGREQLNAWWSATMYQAMCQAQQNAKAFIPKCKDCQKFYANIDDARKMNSSESTTVMRRCDSINPDFYCGDWTGELKYKS